MTTLTLIRGLPGSGKSTIAKELGGYHIEADMFHMTEEGVYDWQASKLKSAHKWCQDTTAQQLEQGCNVIVSNTFTTIKELRPYFNIAAALNIVPVVIIAQNEFTNIHAVPEEALLRMRNRFVWDISEMFDV